MLLLGTTFLYLNFKAGMKLLNTIVILPNVFSPNFQANPFGKHGRCSQETSYCLATEAPAKTEFFLKLKIIQM